MSKKSVFIALLVGVFIVACSIVDSGQVLAPGDSVASENGNFTLTMQHDGNLVLYNGYGVAMWNSRTDHIGAGANAVMQEDGNLVVYDSGGNAAWESGTAGHPGAFARVQNDGKVMIYLDNTPLWQSTYAFVLPRSQVSRTDLTDPHHDYPALDVGIPVGTPIYAPTGGRIVRYVGGDCGLGLELEGYDGVFYKFCHGSARRVSPGDYVATNDHIMDSGNTGNSTAPHLHLSVEINGQFRCPQNMMASLYDGDTLVDPNNLPATGCID